MQIDYKLIMSEMNRESYEQSIAIFCEKVSRIWIDNYRQNTDTITNIIRFEDKGFTFLFDDSSELLRNGTVTSEDCVDERVVVVYGRSKNPKTKRDNSRMRGFLGSFVNLFKDVSYDKGHFIGHSLGGGLDVNLFPQRSEINRGWSQKGKLYRSMERYCAENIGTFCFSRPIYNNKSWIPHEIEYGILLSPDNIWVEKFEND